MKTTNHLKISLSCIFIIFVLMAFPQRSSAHCEIPCGIYGDSIRIILLQEHISTIKKSMEQIKILSAETPISYNQLVRWVMNKEEHAKKIQEITTQYFMFQRIKLSEDPKMAQKNGEMLKYLHELSVYAMKAKQTTDEIYCEKMLHSLKQFQKLYFSDKKIPHKH